MHCAVYARKSTAETGMNDEEKSVTCQVEHAKLYAAKKGWTVSEEHVYSDDGISGAEFLKRPGFICLMNALKPRPAFHFLVMSEESSLGREQIETATRSNRSWMPVCACSFTSKTVNERSIPRSTR